MRRVLFYFVQVAVIVAAAVWLADNPGTVSIDWLGYRIETYFAVLLGLVAALVLLFDALHGLWRVLSGAPGNYLSRRKARRREEGFRALALGMAAAAAGDRDEVLRLARRADSLLQEPEVTRLLSAQAASLNGDEAAARRYFDALTHNAETAFIGLTGLLRQAMREGDTERAFELAERARRARPDSTFAIETLFDLQTRAGRWKDAQATLFDAVRRKIRPESDALIHRTAIFLARAQEAAEEGRLADAIDLCDRAQDSSPDFPPVITLRARVLARSGKIRAASRYLEGAWSRNPHPELVAAYTDLWPADSPLDRFRRVQRLTANTPDAPESRLATAAAALDSKFWGEARRTMAALGEPEELGARACRLMARLEEEEHGDSAAARVWLERSARAPADDGWTCQSCGAQAAAWSALCGNCGAFATVAWKKPPGVALLPVPPEPDAVIEEVVQALEDPEAAAPAEGRREDSAAA